MSVALGQDFLNFKTTKSSCLYLALEDSFRRLQDRMNKLLDGKEAPNNFFFANDSYKTDNGLLNQLEMELERNPSLSLIIIDTLQKVRKSQNGSSVYAQDYDEISLLKKLADKNHIAIVIIHHTKKAENDNDKFSNISGSNGIAGSVDTMIVMSKDKRNNTHTIFSLTGRDIDSNEIVLAFDKYICKWKYIGSSEEIEIVNQKTEYDNSPVIKIIKSILEQKKSVALTADQVKDKIKETLGIECTKAPRTISDEIKKYIPFLNEDGIKVEKPNPNGGTKGRLFTFYNE